MNLFHQLKKINLNYYLLTVLLLLNLAAGHYFLRFPADNLKDSVVYFQAMQFLSGEEIDFEVPYNRLLTTPLMLQASILMSKITGSFFSGMIGVNIIFYFLIIFLFYKLVLEIYDSHKVALGGSILLLFNFYFFSIAFSALCDAGGWFFFILASFLAIKFYKNRYETKFYYLSILASSIGVLFKEYGALGLISLCLLIFISDYSLKEKARKALAAGLLFAVIPVIYHFIFYLQYDYSYFNWYMSVQNDFGYKFGTAAYTPGNFIKVLGWLYLAGWPVFLWGLWQEKKCFNRSRAKILLALLPASLSFFAWPAFVQRIAVVFVPWLAAISGFGLSKMSGYLAAIILLIYIAVNYNIERLLVIINLPF